ncbi:MAG: hypothetical protein IJ047_01355 [Paludibacteraceae bacterium]|nr:hypothetical protein [Paludibacteraceae bacterium]
MEINSLANISTDYEVIFHAELAKFVSSKRWANERSKLLSSIRLHVADRDIDALKSFLRDEREKCLKGFQANSQFYILEKCFDDQLGSFDVIKFFQKLIVVNEGELDSAELEDFFIYHCLTNTIDHLLAQAFDWEARQKSATISADNIVIVNGEIIIQKSKKQQEEESVVGEELDNIIFNYRIFDTDSKLTKLRDIIAASINMGEDNGKLVQPEKEQINPNTKNEWYYIFKAIDEAGIVISRKFKDSTFIEQMISWFPWLFQFDSAEEMNVYKRNWQKSISHERSLWRSKGNVTQIKDMWANYKNLNLERDKVVRMNAIAKGLLRKLSDYRSEIFMSQM